MLRTYLSRLRPLWQSTSHPFTTSTTLLLDASPKTPESVMRAVSLTNGSRAELRRARKQQLISTYQRTPNDTGSSEVQIAVLSDRIKDMTAHMQTHRKDQTCRRRLTMAVAKRRKIMQYLLRRDAAKYMQVVEKLGLRPSSVFSKDVPLGAKKAPTPQLH